MIYECDKCTAALPPGALACPKCGDAFEDAVPADAEVPASGFTAKPDAPPVPVPAPATDPQPVHYLPPLKSPMIGPLRQDGFSEYSGAELMARGKAQNKANFSVVRVVVMLFFIVVVGGTIGTCAASMDKSTSAPAASTPASPLDTAVTDLGGVGTLQGAPLEKGGKNIVVVLGQTEDDFKAYSDANVAGDTAGIRQLVDSGRVFLLRSGSVQAKKIDSNWTGSVRVRILSGTYQNQAGWTYMESLQK